MRRSVYMRGSTGVALCVVVIGLTGVAGCDSDYAKEFREVATPSLHSGVSSILNGVVDGIFAILDPDTDTTEATP